MEALEEENETENCRHTEAGSEEPTGLTQGVNQEHAHKQGDGSRKGDGVVGTHTHQTGNLELTQHEADQGEGTVEGGEGPQTT